MEYEGFLLCSKKSTTCPCPEADEAIPSLCIAFPLQVFQMVTLNNSKRFY